MFSRGLAFGAPLLALLFVGCSGNSSGVDAGPIDAGVDGGIDAGIDAGPDAGPALCASIGASCTSISTCCGNLVCASGTCQTPDPICAGYAEPCSDTVSCCGKDAGPFTCVSIDGGFSICVSGLPGASCTQSSQCAAPYACVSGQCDYPMTGVTCSGTNCHAGDDCSDAPIVQDEGTNRTDSSSLDPCAASNLTCIVVGETTDAFVARCIDPVVLHPPSFPYPDGAPFDSSVCDSATASCVEDAAGAPRGSATCGFFFLDPFDNSHCFDSCTTGEDCGSSVEDCLGGICVPNYCFAAGTSTLPDGGVVSTGAYLTPYSVASGGSIVSSDPRTLFTACSADAGFPRACLPGYDDILDTSSGYCVRVGAEDAGGWGAFCDPNPYRNNPNGYCAFGTFCDKGTCLPWCDLGTTSFLQCPSSTICTRLPSGYPLTSTAAGTTNSLGVCTGICNPYIDAAHNECAPFGTDAGQPPTVCKFSESQNDQSPPPGMCLSGVANPTPVGLPCSPFGWADPCVSGAECVPALDGGIAYVCAQLCDPSPSPGVNAPSCLPPTTCIPFQDGVCEGTCSHEGTCQ